MRARALMLAGLVAMACGAPCRADERTSLARLGEQGGTQTTARIACRVRLEPRRPRPIWRAATRRRLKHTFRIDRQTRKRSKQSSPRRRGPHLANQKG